MNDLPDEIARINALTTNARNTWLVMLGVLVFVGITLMGVEHIDFYGVDRNTNLPLVNVEVPTRSFFVAAPILTAAIYGYFHLYLIRLWDAIGIAKPRYRGRPLGDVITPWLVTDAALHWRTKIRSEPCQAARAMETPSMLLNMFLAWWFGLIVMGLLWWFSMPARNFVMTATSAFSLVACIACGYVSWRSMMLRMRSDTSPETSATSERLATIIPTVSFYFLIFVSLFRTELPQSGVPLAALSLADKEITARPKDWLECEFARKDELSKFAAREKLDQTRFNVWPRKKVDEFNTEWLRRRDAQIARIEAADLSSADFRNADLTNAFGVGLTLPPAPWTGAALSLEIFEGTRYFNSVNCTMNWAQLPLQGVSLVDARLNGANMRSIDLSEAKLTRALLERADLTFANLSKANLSQTQLKGAVLIRAQLVEANLSDAQMQTANLTGARLENAKLNGAQLQNAKLNGAILDHADFDSAQLQGAVLEETRLRGALLNWVMLQGADLSRAEMQDANLFGAHLRETKLRKAKMQNANLNFSLLMGQRDQPILGDEADFRAAVNRGGALRFVDLQRALFDENTDFRNVFLDGTVLLPDSFFQQTSFEGVKPCQWIIQPVSSDKDFFALWRWWAENDPENGFLVDWEFIAPTEWSLIEPADAKLRARYGIPENCAWKVGPISKNNKSLRESSEE